MRPGSVRKADAVAAGGCAAIGRPGRSISATPSPKSSAYVFAAIEPACGGWAWRGGGGRTGDRDCTQHDRPWPGVYDIAANAGWVNLGITHDTAAFAVESIRRWWHELGAARYPAATRLLITADCGGSNGVRVRLWKRELQVLADELGIVITVCHLPPGTSKWNRIEHRLFAFITQNWRGKPLLSHQVIIQLIANTRTNTGLTVACRIDANAYDKGVKVSDAEMAALNIQTDDFQGEWNYTFAPRRPDE